MYVPLMELHIFHSLLTLSHNSWTPFGGVLYNISDVPKGLQWDLDQDIGLLKYNLNIIVFKPLLGLFGGMF